MLFPILAKGGRPCPVFPHLLAPEATLSFQTRHLLVTVSTLVLISALIWRRPLLSVWSVPHRLGTLATQRLWMFIIQSVVSWENMNKWIKPKHAQIWMCWQRRTVRCSEGIDFAETPLCVTWLWSRIFTFRLFSPGEATANQLPPSLWTTEAKIDVSWIFTWPYKTMKH